MARYRRMIILGVTGATVLAGSIATATFAHADPGFNAGCMPTAPGFTISQSSTLFEGTYVKEGRLIRTIYDYEFEERTTCEYQGELRQWSVTDDVAIGTHTWISRRIYNSYSCHVENTYEVVCD